MPSRSTRYVEVPLTSALYHGLSDREQSMIPLLIDAARRMDAIFWQETYGDGDTFLVGIADPALRRFAEINRGPWDRLDGNAPFVPGVGAKPLGAQFYPADMSRAEFESASAVFPAGAAALKSPYTLVRRNGSGALTTVPYHVAFADDLKAAAAKLHQAAALAEDAGLRRYLETRAAALLDDEYRPSDLAWLDMKENGVDIVIGPIEDYEDRLLGHKAAHEALVLIRDREWSARLARFAKLLPQLQRDLPVPDAYKRETPGSDSDLNAYDVVFCAGEANAGAKAVAINLPNDDEVQLAKGTRRLQLTNVMRAKFDLLLLPIADRLISRDQRPHVTFDAFFQNAMFHEVAHGLGIKHTLDGKGTVHDVLAEQHGALEEGKADILGLYLVERLQEMGELGDADLLDNFVTFLAGFFRSIRFGASEAHGRANLTQFEFFRERAAFSRDDATGTYRVDVPRMRQAVLSLSEKMLRLQGDGDYQGVVAFLRTQAEMDPTLTSDLRRLDSADIPTDITFRQGIDVLRGSVE